MFLSNTFQYTRGEKLGLPVNFYLKKQENSNVPENINLDNHNRNVLKDYGPDRTSFAFEAPRLDNGSVEKLNIRHYGAIRPELPYRVDNELDTQFYDKDPRGFSGAPDLHKMTEDSKPRANLQLFGKDQDYSITGEGINVRDMENRIQEMRRELRGRLNWFQDSLDTFIVGNYGPRTSTDDQVVMEDTSSLIDPTIMDSTGRQNINRIMSNNLHMGGKYFTERTTPDQVLPVASYGFVFKSGIPLTPHERTELISGDQTPRQSKANRNTIKAILSGKSSSTNDSVLDSRFNKLLETQNTGYQVNKDIMAILGLTEHELKYIKNLETDNKGAYNKCISGIIEMLTVLEKLPQNARFELRDKLFSLRTPEFFGGMAKSKYDHKIKDLLSAKNTNTPAHDPKKITTVSETKSKESKESKTSNVPFFERKKNEPQLEKIDYSNLIMRNKAPAKQGETADTISEDFGSASIETTAKRLLTFKHPELTDTSNDMDFGVEHVRNDEIKSRPYHKFFR